MANNSPIVYVVGIYVKDCKGYLDRSQHSGVAITVIPDENNRITICDVTSEYHHTDEVYERIGALMALTQLSDRSSMIINTQFVDPKSSPVNYDGRTRDDCYIADCLYDRYMDESSASCKAGVKVISRADDFTQTNEDISAIIDNVMDKVWDGTHISDCTASIDFKFDLFRNDWFTRL